MKIPKGFREAIAGLPVPASPMAYFEGCVRKYFCALDDILLFARTDAADLQRRSAESHLHRRFCLVTCLETPGTVSVDGIPFVLGPGQAHLVFPQSYHHFLELGKTSLLWLMVTFETAEPERLANLRHRTLQLDDDDIGRLAEMVKSFSGSTRPDRGDALGMTLSRLACKWCRSLESEGKRVPLPQSRKDGGLWRRFQIQLEQLQPEDLRIGPLSARLSISDRHLRQKFLDQFGLPLGTYLRNYRIRRAIGLLVTTDLSMAEIADRCGYGSSASFHRAFLDHTGVGPGGFRKQPVSGVAT